MSEIELTVVLPCLNEEQSVGICVRKIRDVFATRGIQGEVIVVDNGSTDDSVRVAVQAGAKVISESVRGYGSALRRGIEDSVGKFIIMGDADDSYDFNEIPAFIEKLREGYDLVMGSRFKGKMLPGAMSWSHRYIGNPILSGMLRLFFRGGVSDAHCGLRGFSREAYKKMGLQTTGMEFASEMVINALKKKMKIAEIPITYHPRKGESKLSSVKDAWRHIRFMLLYSPNYLFLIPGGLIFIVGFLVTLRFLAGPIWFAGRNWDIHVMVFSAILSLVGWQIFTTGFSAKIYAHQIGLEESEFTKKMLGVFTIERALALGGIFILVGAGLIGYIFYAWARNGFGELSQVKTGLFALLLIAIGFQTVFASFLSGIIQVRYKR